MANKTFTDQVHSYINSGSSLLYISTPELYNTVVTLQQSLPINNREMFMWDNTQGWQSLVSNEWSVIDKNATDPYEVVNLINNNAVEDSIILLMNFHWYCGKECEYTLLQDLINHYYIWKKSESRRTVIIVGSEFDIHNDLQRLVQYIPHNYPDKEELRQVFDSLLYDVGEQVIQPSDNKIDQLISAGSGLTCIEFENVLSYSITAKNKKTKANEFDTDIVTTEKVRSVNKDGYLKFYPYDTDLNAVGGLDVLKKWLDIRRKAFSEEAQRFGLPYPKGMILLGVPGCGKSLVAKCLSSHWQIPLVQLDFGKLFSSMVGQSEQRTRFVQNQIEALSPCILWIDEAEKALAGSYNSNSTDSGVTKRLFGSWLSWLQERPKDKIIYIVMTVNDVFSLPPELFRKGRFDEVFWVDMPDYESRKEIWEIHLSSRSKSIEDINSNIEKLSDITDGFVGSEIEAAVEGAMFIAFANQEELQMKHLVQGVNEIIPLSKTRGKEIESMRKAYANNVKNASSVRVSNNKQKTPSSGRMLSFN